MHGKMPNHTTTAVQQPPKAHLGLPTTSWLRPSSFEKHRCLCVGQWSSPTNRGQFHHDLRCTTLLTVNNCCSAAASSPMHLQANHAPPVTPPIAHETCRNPDHTHSVYFSTTATRQTAMSTPDMLCPHTALAMNRHLWLRHAQSAPYAETPSQKN